MKIKWMGHSCFLLTAENGVRILTDPFNEQVGYELPETEADIVTTSHGHYDHNYIKVVKGNFAHIDKPGTYSICDIDIKGIQTFHDNEGGNKRGMNVVFRFNIDGLNICHCGDLGHLPDQDTIDAVGKVDILMLPVGGVYTIDSREAAEVVKLIRPAIAIPMHYSNPELKFDLGSVDDFVSAVGGGQRFGRQEVELNSKNISSFSSILILNYKYR